MWKCVVTDSHFDVLMVLLGIRRLIVQRLQQNKEETDQTISHIFSCVTRKQQIDGGQMTEFTPTSRRYDSGLAPNKCFNVCRNAHQITGVTESSD